MQNAWKAEIFARFFVEKQKAGVVWEAQRQAHMCIEKGSVFCLTLCLLGAALQELVGLEALFICVLC